MSNLERALRELLRNWLLTAEERERLAAPQVTPSSVSEPSPEEPFDPEDPKNWLSLDYIEEVTQAQMKRQSDEWDLVDGRLRLVLGVVGIVFAAVLGFQRGPSQLEWPVAFLVMMAIVMFLIAGASAAIVYWPMTFNWPPDLTDFREYLTTDPRDSKRELRVGNSSAASGPGSLGMAAGGSMGPSGRSS
jgi:hypothetical protein